MHFILAALMRLFASLVSRGGEPRTERNADGPVLVYGLRPGTLVFFLGCLVFAAAALALDLPRFRTGGLAAIHPIRLPLALLLGALAVVMLTRTLTLDESGLHHRGPLGPHHFIAWADLGHVEQYRSRPAGKSTWYLRSRDNRTTITLPEMTYNTAHLLAEIRRRVPLPELPRRRRHWWGG